MSEQPPKRRADDSRWFVVDKHIPIAVILALLIQTGGVVWWASRTDNRVAMLEAWVSKNDTVNERLARIEVGIGYLTQRLDDRRAK